MNIWSFKTWGPVALLSATGGSLAAMLVRGFWNDISAAYLQGILSAAAIFVAIWLQERQRSTERNQSAARELIMCHSLSVSVLKIVDQICKDRNNPHLFLNHYKIWKTYLENDIDVLKQVDLGQLTTRDAPATVINIRRTALMALVAMGDSADSAWSISDIEQIREQLINGVEKLGREMALNRFAIPNQSNPEGIYGG